MQLQFQSFFQYPLPYQLSPPLPQFQVKSSWIHPDISDPTVSSNIPENKCSCNSNHSFNMLSHTNSALPSPCSKSKVHENTQILAILQFRAIFLKISAVAIPIILSICSPIPTQCPLPQFHVKGPWMHPDISDPTVSSNFPGKLCSCNSNYSFKILSHTNSALPFPSSKSKVHGYTQILTIFQFRAI